MLKVGNSLHGHKGRFGKLYFEEEAILSFKIKNKVAKSGPQTPTLEIASVNKTYVLFTPHNKPI